MAFVLHLVLSVRFIILTTGYDDGGMFVCIVYKSECPPKTTALTTMVVFSFFRSLLVWSATRLS